MRWCGGISLLQWCEDINWTLVSLFLLSWQDGIWMPYSKRALSLLSELNKELNLFNNAWAFTLTQHFLPFFSCTTFSILARGFLMTLHEDSQCMRWTSPTVRWPMFMEALPRLGIFFFFLWCDVLFTVCIQCELWYVSLLSWPLFKKGVLAKACEWAAWRLLQRFLNEGAACAQMRILILLSSD